MPARSSSPASSQSSFVVDDSSDLFFGHQRTEVRHAAALHGRAGVGATSDGRRQVADTTHAVGLAELGALADELDVVGPVGELPDGDAVGEVGPVGARTGHFG